MKENKNLKPKVGPFATRRIPISGAVIIFAAAGAYICMKLADELRYNEKWKDYDECGWN